MVGQKVAAFLPPGISYFSSHKHTILYGQIWQAARKVNSTTQKKNKRIIGHLFPSYVSRSCIDWEAAEWKKAFGIPGQSSSPLMCWPFLITTQPQKYRIVMPQMLHKKHISQSWSKRAIVQQLLHCPPDWSKSNQECTPTIIEPGFLWQTAFLSEVSVLIFHPFSVFSPLSFFLERSENLG